MGSSAKPLHFVLFPHLAPGHLLPLFDTARLLAQRGATITIFTSPGNASRFESLVSRAVSSGYSIQFVQVQIPFKEAGLPEGCENFDMLQSYDLAFKLYTAIRFMHKPSEILFEALPLKPSCIISDVCVPWTLQIARKHNIPRITFHIFSTFFLLSSYKFGMSQVTQNTFTETEHVAMSEIPDQNDPITEIQTQAQLSQKLMHYSIQMMAADIKSYGAIVNSSEAVEPESIEEYKKLRNGKAWCVGPVWLCNKNELDKAERGNKASIDKHYCLEWLNLQEENSVDYACLGSVANLSASQLIELGLGLEASKRPFVWVIRGGDNLKELEKWIKEDGFEERIKGRGLLIRGWAPQVLILSHSAIGEFITHCGWGSILEAITCGVPIITWPLFADQFCNQINVAKVLKIGVRIGAEDPVNNGEGEKIEALVKKEDIKRAIEELMDEGEESEESEERRRRVREMGEMANKAAEEGGSSHVDLTSLTSLTSLIEDIKQQSTSTQE
ncbi:Glycosyltransferase [Quillaja saponaria]|uniref:Glycosyltransferase n=1 Tax=Quillaja saponaria TaxID=32244 RepID=A0AAD7VE31_QUISA|nr:Glycosyltransferase [Quillaja saponaria]